MEAGPATRPLLALLIRPFEVTVAGDAIPQWVSIVGLVVAGGISVMLWRESRTAR